MDWKFLLSWYKTLFLILSPWRLCALIQYTICSLFHSLAEKIKTVKIWEKKFFLLYAKIENWIRKRLFIIFGKNFFGIKPKKLWAIKKDWIWLKICVCVFVRVEKLFHSLLSPSIGNFFILKNNFLRGLRGEVKVSQFSLF